MWLRLLPLLAAILLFAAKPAAAQFEDCGLEGGACPPQATPNINVQISPETIIKLLKAKKKVVPPKPKASPPAKPEPKSVTPRKVKQAPKDAGKTAPAGRQQRPAPEKKKRTATPIKAGPETKRDSWTGLAVVGPMTLQADDFETVPGQFIVELDTAALAAAGSDIATLSPNQLAAILGLQVGQVRSIQPRFLFSAIAVNVTPAQLPALALNPFVTLLTADTWIRPAGNEVPLPWGLDRLDSPFLPLDGAFDREGGSYRARIYLLDSPAAPNSREFGSRLTFGTSFLYKIRETISCQGHGTHMASLIAGATTGAAPKAEIIEVNVLPCEKSERGTASSVHEAVEWIMAREAAQPGGTPAIANMSFAGPRNDVINKDVKRLLDSGVVVVAAAGNEGKAACAYSPASAEHAITVGSLGPDDRVPRFSNKGKCVDIYAPGSLLTALDNDSAQRFIALEGTSGATALVTGILARSLGTKGHEAAADWLFKRAAPVRISPDPGTVLNLVQMDGSWHDFCRVGARDASPQRPVFDRAGGAQRGHIAVGAWVKVKRVQARWAEVEVQGQTAGWLETSKLGEPLLLNPADNMLCSRVH